ncbi:MAG TPA: acyl-CoA dehydrogenase C-terminal domain-containing protein [Steroidobacteraceae bacterium]|nr:acyl-CoA dehydrogenase C-terminal domain-containing protein [Steroidobacteraceae bacterium]
MYSYRAPLRDIRFVVHEVLDFEENYRAYGREELTRELLEGILEEGARFAEDVLAPTNRVGDEHGLTFENGQVGTPPGFKEAYDRYCHDGWITMTADPAWGGQGLPAGFSLAFGEMLVSGNMAWRMYSGLTESASLTIAAHATEELKQRYLPKMVKGEWSGTMCLTESHSGTDLGILKTKAEPQADGSYALTGTKIFISAGEHDLTSNIIHLVLARLPDAPAGTRGISLFLVPKFLPDAAGNAGAANGVSCGSIEHKMGIHASPTCVMHFNDSIGWLVGKPNEGLACMFTMMNHARLGVGLQGHGLSELAWQASIAYANDRLQGRAMTGPKEPGKPADPIIVHPDVRRMLLTQKAFVEGGRVLCFLTGREIDSAHLNADETARRRSNDLIAFLTPIVKGFLTEAAMEVTSLAVQIHGGHGFIRQTGVEQLMRDARITPIYEGTNGVQALDLLGRKVFGTGGKSQQMIAARMVESIQKFGSLPELAPFAADLGKRLEQWGRLTTELGAAAMKNPEEVGAAATDYLHIAGYMCLGWCWLVSAGVAAKKLAGNPDDDFYKAKLVTARHYFTRIFPRVDAHMAAARAGAAGLMALTADQFAIA